jgi:hypothetical protein
VVQASSAKHSPPKDALTVPGTSARSAAVDGTSGTAGAQVTIKRHGLAFFQGIVQAKGWHGRRPVSLAVDLAAGRVDAALAA